VAVDVAHRDVVSSIRGMTSTIRVPASDFKYQLTPQTRIRDFIFETRERSQKGKFILQPINQPTTLETCLAKVTDHQTTPSLKAMTSSTAPGLRL